MKSLQKLTQCFNPAEAEEGFRRQSDLYFYFYKSEGFNPAEAEEGFRRFKKENPVKAAEIVSIQPKPKKGLEV